MMTDETFDEIAESRKPYDPDRTIRVALLLEMIKEIQTSSVKIAYGADNHPKYSRERLELLGEVRGLNKAVMIIEKLLESSYEN